MNPCPQKSEKITILGVDPGLQVSGYAAVSATTRELKILDAGVIRVAAEGTMAARLKTIYDEAAGLLDEHQPAVLAIEELYAHYKHPRTAILMGHARGMFLLAAAQRRIEVRGFAATRIKKSLTGNGRAGKEQMQYAVMTQLNLKRLPEPADVADALAAAMCCANELQRENTLKERPPRH
jgi:crossover junction endodeoxyribonuclease RuvC